ncbi:MAG: cyclic nucleotide-binding domain-containing protein [Myxococcota bacterium]|nr:cyclic nucleotide-binding domain-containing protein [Myxococcota bacterium]
MKVTSSLRTDVGQTRDSNEDFMLSDQTLNAFVVCDGVGGHEHGEVASSEAAHYTIEYLREHRKLIEDFVDGPDSREALTDLLSQAVQGAGKKIWNLAHNSSPASMRMGTTLTLLVIIADKGFMAHIGDSRLVLQRNQETHQLSDDHTYLAEVLQKAELTEAQKRKHPMRNVVTRALGQSELVMVDTLIFDVLPDDTFLLCSDGLHQYVYEPTELSHILNEDNLDEVSDRLIYLANERGGSDNITAIVVRAHHEGKDSAALRERTQRISTRLATMKHVDLFRYLSHKEILQLQTVAETVNLSKHTTIFIQGHSSDSLFIVLEGEVSVERNGILITTLVAGAHFGEMALLSARPRSATARTVRDSQLLKIARDRINELIKKQPVLGVKLLWNLSQVLSLRLDATTGEFAQTAASALDSAPTSKSPLPF